ncbi:MAG: phage/plasmid replication protein [Bacteroidota bacterium]
MFIDWLDMYQDFDNISFPQLSEVFNLVIDSTTGETLRESQPTHIFEGSFSTKINIRISGGRLSVSGNPSRLNRLDNLFGFTSIDSAVDCYNFILRSLDLPIFTRSSGLKFKRSCNIYKYSDLYTAFSDGAVFTRIDLTSNISVGSGNEEDYLKGVSTLKYRYMIPRLHTNGFTVDWVNHKGKSSSLIYPCVYIKHEEISLNSLPKIKRSFGVHSKEYKYLLSIQKYCFDYGVVRFEQKLKSQFLRNNPLFRYYGLASLQDFKNLHSEFLNITDKLQVTAMSLENISERLLRLGICSSTKASNTTAMYALMWMSGKRFPCIKSQEKVHRARLNRIGLDIKMQCDLSRFSAVYIKKAREVIEESLPIPAWYVPAGQHLRLVA